MKKTRKGLLGGGSGRPPICGPPGVDGGLHRLRVEAGERGLPGVEIQAEAGYGRHARGASQGRAARPRAPRARAASWPSGGPCPWLRGLDRVTSTARRKEDPPGHGPDRPAGRPDDGTAAPVAPVAPAGQPSGRRRLMNSNDLGHNGCGGESSTS